MSDREDRGGQGHIIRPQGVDGFGVGPFPPPTRLCLTRLVWRSFIVREGVTCLVRNPEIADERDVRIDSGGELLVL